MGACGRGAPDWTSKDRVQATVENAQRFQAGVGAHVLRMTSKARPCPRQARQLPQAASRLAPRSVGRGGAGERGRRNGSPGCPRTIAIDLVHTWGTPLWDVSASPLALAGVVAEVGQGVDLPQLSIEPARNDEGIEALSQGPQGGEL